MSAHAKIFTVDTFNDEADESLNDERCISTEGNCSLRAAIQEANTLAGSHTIVLKSGNYYLTLTGRDENNSATGDLDIKTNISIEGTGAANTIINADSPFDELPPEGIDRIFDINSATVTLKNLSITRGEILTKETSINPGGIGGGIRVLNATLNLDNVWVYGNTAGAGLGGGIFSINSTVNIQHSVIHLNYAAIGAGMASISSQTSVNESFFRGVTGVKNKSYLGAGIYNSGDLTITKSIFSNHSVRIDGGAVYHEKGKLRVRNSTFNGNRAERNGGAIYYRAGEILTAYEEGENRITPVLQNTTVTYNHAYNLGYSHPGIDYMITQLRSLDITQFFMDNDGSALIFSDSLIDNSVIDIESAIGGGGIVIAEQDPVQEDVPLHITITNSLFANNTYDVNNLIGGNYVRANIVLGDCTITTLSDIISLGGNAASSDGCDFEHAADLGVIKSGDFKLRPMSSNGKIFNNETDYLSLKTQNEFNSLKPQVQLFAEDSPIRNAAVAPYCLEDDQLGEPRVNCDIGAYEYSSPQANSMHYITTPGKNITGMFSLAGPELPEATYEIMTELDSSIGVLTHPDISSPNWSFTASSTEAGNVNIVYKTCSQLINECTEEATIRFETIDNPVSTATISVESPTGDPTVSSIHTIDKANLILGAADENYSFPVGAMYFNIEDVPASGAVTVTLQLPLNTSFDEEEIDKVKIRKLNTSGNWVDLPIETELGLSSGQYDDTTKIITLILADGDTFDLNPNTGSIRGPVALGIPAKEKNTNAGLKFTGAGSALYLLICLFSVGWARSRFTTATP